MAQTEARIVVFAGTPSIMASQFCVCDGWSPP